MLNDVMSLSCLCWVRNRHGNILERHRVVLADSELVETQFISTNHQFHVLVVSLGQRLSRVVKRHDEDAGFDV